MREYYKMATQQSQKKKGAPVGVIIGAVTTGILLFGILFLVSKEKRSN
jgi:hypothetical protein